MIILKRAILTILLVILVACVPQKDFMYGLKQLNAINSKYNTTMETYPKSTQGINSMINDLAGIKGLQLESGQESFDYLIAYRLIDLEAEKLLIESQKDGIGDISKTGFACKPRPLIIESVALRNKSAQKGFEAVSLLREFIDKYPENAKAAGLSYKNALFLNASFYEIARIARSNSNIINGLCPKNITLELYQEEFRKKTNFSEEYIKNLKYEEAAEIWKNLRGLN